jgi:tripartite-type tricarboxylate transporter receptor subunit TctC
MMKRTALAHVVACLTLLASPAFAQEWPTKPIRMITGGAGGSASDLLGRIYGEYFLKKTGQSWVMDNRPGAGSTISGQAAKTAPNGGYDFYLTQVAALAIAPYVYSKMNYDPVKDFDPVARMVTSPPVFFARKNDERIKSLADLIKLARANPGKLKYAVASVGTTTNMSIAYFKKAFGLDMVMVPYKSSSETLLSVVSGETDFSAENIQAIAGHIDDIRPIGVTGRERTPLLPDVPTVAESGIADFDITSWFGVVAPKGTPPAIVNRMAELIKEADQDPETRKKIMLLGANPGYLEPARFGQFIADEVKKWGPIVENAGVPKE